jgi:hypothetical protein
MQNTVTAFQLLNGEFLKQAGTISQLLERIYELEDAVSALRREMIEQATEDTDVDDTPAVETPAIDTPAVDTLAIDTPAVDTPAIDTPAVETPVVETPVIEAPVIDTPAIDTLVVETPVIETPAIETPIIETPIIEAPVVEVDESEYTHEKYTSMLYAQLSSIRATYDASKALFQHPSVKNEYPYPNLKRIEADCRIKEFENIKIIATEDASLALIRWEQLVEHYKLTERRIAKELSFALTTISKCRNIKINFDMEQLTDSPLVKDNDLRMTNPDGCMYLYDGGVTNRMWRLNDQGTLMLAATYSRPFIDGERKVVVCPLDTPTAHGLSIEPEPAPVEPTPTPAPEITLAPTPAPAPATELTPTLAPTVLRQYGYLNEFKKPMTIAQRATVNERTYVSVFHGIDANYGGDVFQFNTLTHAHFFRAEKKANHVYVWMDTATKVDWKPTHIPEVLKRIA